MRKELIETRISKLMKSLETTEESISSTIISISHTTKDISIEEGEVSETKKEIKIVERKKLRQKCAVIFPKIFLQFSKNKARKAAGMCPCPGSGSGVSTVSMIVDDPDEAAHVIENLF